MTSKSKSDSSSSSSLEDDNDMIVVDKATTFSVEKQSLKVHVSQDDGDDESLNVEQASASPDKTFKVRKAEESLSDQPSPLVEKLKLLDCLESLKFDPNKEKSESKSNASSKSLIGTNSNPTTSGMGSKLKPSASAKSKSKVDQTFEKSGSWLSGQPEVQKEAERSENNHSQPSYAAIFKEWGKRPLLVESEAPWTRRNKMYTNAIKALEKAKQRLNAVANANQANGNNISNNQIPPMGANTLGGNPQQVMYPAGRPGPVYTTLPVRGDVMPQVIMSPAGGNPNPIVSQITPLPPNLQSRPLQVAFESPFNYQEIVMPVQPPPPTPPPATVMFGHLDGQGLWVPLIQQIHQLQQQQFQQIQVQQQQQQQQQQRLQQQQDQLRVYQYNNRQYEDTDDDEDD